MSKDRKTHNARKQEAKRLNARESKDDAMAEERRALGLLDTADVTDETE